MNTTLTTTSPTTTIDRLMRLALVLALLATTATTIALGAGPAAAHDGHASGEATMTSSVRSTEPTRPANLEAKSGAAAASLIAKLHLTKKTDGEKTGRDRRPAIKDLTMTPRLDKGAGPDADCFVDFDDDLVLQFQPNGAEDTFLLSPWYQGCNDGNYYPAIGVEPMEYGHVHLGYEDPRIGPCDGNQTDWGRKADPIPDSNIGPWVLAPCVEDIDPATEPRSGISPHLPGHRVKVFAYTGHTDTEYLPFSLSTLEVVKGSVEVCHLPPSYGLTAAPGGSAWDCSTFGEGYWNMSNVVDNAIEVRIEFLSSGMIDNIGLDLL